MNLAELHLRRRVSNFGCSDTPRRLLFLIGILSLIFSGRVSAREISSSMPERGICAHRGASATHPENTLTAFREAILRGAQMIESVSYTHLTLPTKA